MTIYIDEETDVEKTLLEKMRQAASLCLEREGIGPENAELSVTFVDKDEIKRLNAEYRGVDSATDVLSFPQYDSPDDFPDEGEICLGDVVICREKMEEQAEEFGHSFEREILYLFTHSVLHLLGYDHETAGEKAEMRAREEEIMNEIGLPSDTELYRKAKGALENAYAPFSKFKVGAALLTDTGEIFTGCNIENSSLGATICAERTACVKAVSEGHRSFKTLAVVSGEGAVWPCGICRQFLYEFAPDLRVITGDDEDHIEELTLPELLTKGFRLK